MERRENKEIKRVKVGGYKYVHGKWRNCEYKQKIKKNKQNQRNKKKMKKYGNKQKYRIN